VTVKGISVGDKYLSYDLSGAVSEGNMFLMRVSRTLGGRSEEADYDGCHYG